MDGSYVKVQKVSLTYNNIKLNTVITYTTTNDKYVDKNDNQLPDCIEYQDLVTDTDGDGLSDYVELCVTDTSIFSVISDGKVLDTMLDIDNDGLTSLQEIEVGTDINIADTYMDGLLDEEEISLGTNPLLMDTDKDGLSDGKEIVLGEDHLSYDREFKVELALNNFKVYEIGSGESIERFQIEEVTDNILLSDSIPGYMGSVYKDKDKVATIMFTKEVIYSADFTLNYDTILDVVKNGVWDNGHTEISGTDVNLACDSALDMFTEGVSGDKNVILSTDGQDTEESIKLDTVIERARKIGVKFHVVGLGKFIDERKLQQLAYQTGGTFTQFEDMLEIAKIESLANELNICTTDKELDSNKDGISDYMTKLIFAKQIRTDTGLSFEGLTEDVAADIDGDGLLNGEEIKLVTREDGSVYMYSNPLVADTDNDGIKDDKDTAPMRKGLMGDIQGELYLLSLNNGKFSGHSFLVYHSLVYDKLDTTKLFVMTNKGRGSNGMYSYTEPDKLVSVGNFANRGVLEIITFNLLADMTGEDGGLLVNYELYDTDKYLKAGELKVNESYITSNSLDKLFRYLNAHNYYNLYNHNCATVAAGAWNTTFKGTVQTYKVNAKWLSYNSYLRLVKNLCNPFIYKRQLEKQAMMECRIDTPYALYQDMLEDSSAKDELFDLIDR